MDIILINIFQSKALEKFTQNWDFGFENKPSGSPDVQEKSRAASFRGIR
jgi:hypothetical protein